MEMEQMGEELEEVGLEEVELEEVEHKLISTD